MSFSLRKATLEDEEFLCAVYSNTRADEMALTGWDDAQQELFLKMQFITQQRFYRMQDPEPDQQVILLGGEPVGRLVVIKTEGEVRLVDIALLPAFREAGVGTLVIRQLLEEAAEAAKPVRLQVERTNHAARLYERLGFVRIGETDTHFQMEWRRQDNDKG